MLIITYTIDLCDSQFINFFFSAEAGYVATPIAMVQAAMTLLNDASDLPKG